MSQKMSASLILRNFLGREVEREQGNRSTSPFVSGQVPARGGKQLVADGVSLDVDKTRLCFLCSKRPLGLGKLKVTEKLQDSRSWHLGRILAEPNPRIARQLKTEPYLMYSQ